MESEQLRYILLNKKKLRCENYAHLELALQNDPNVDPNNLGHATILPSTHVNCPRYLYEYTQDCFAYVREKGRLALFITCACNPGLKEITDELMPDPNAIDRHDLRARVSYFKVKKL